ncbi:MAG TPA: DUF4118 domain-containing protein, partial [Phototrophicaceae bacterium]|nr:DUF4118 domain-containing protein [Phototrophicaceae bacterium]
MTTRPISSTRKSTVNTIGDYGFATGITLIALFISVVLWSILSDTPFFLILAAVVLSAWRGGLGPGVFSAALSVLLVDYFLITPHQLFSLPVDILQFTLFALVAVLISWLEDRRRASEQSLQRVKDELEVILNSIPDGITAQ